MCVTEIIQKQDFQDDCFWAVVCDYLLLCINKQSHLLSERKYASIAEKQKTGRFLTIPLDTAGLDLQQVFMIVSMMGVYLKALKSMKLRNFSLEANDNSTTVLSEKLITKKLVNKYISYWKHITMKKNQDYGSSSFLLRIRLHLYAAKMYALLDVFCM